jgi:hypothetical protein
MDANDMKTLNDIYIKILKTGRSLYAKSDGSLNIRTAQRLESYSTYLGEMNEKTESILDLTDKYAKECLNRATEIRKQIDINKKYNCDDPSHMFMAHKEMYYGLSWADITEIEDNTNQVVNDVNDKVRKNTNKKDYEHNPIIYKNLSTVYGKKIGFDWKVPIIHKLNEMPPSLYWYAGDTTNPEGIYTCLTKGFYIQVPFPNVIDATQDFNRTGSIGCKYNNINECLEAREELANRFNSKIRDCNFAHKGDKYIKIGTTFRCPHKPRFGNHTHLSEDIGTIPDSDIKTILMYSLSDIVLSSMWFQKQKDEDTKKTNIIMTNIDIC